MFERYAIGKQTGKIYSFQEAIELNIDEDLSVIIKPEGYDLRDGKFVAKEEVETTCLSKKRRPKTEKEKKVLSDKLKLSHANKKLQKVTE
jgi:hypothetical protein